MMKERIDNLNQELTEMGKELGREIHLVAVTKFYELDRIDESIELGIKAVGENRAQEFLAKADHLQGKVDLHFIGHLQRNKVRQILPYTDLIHSVDSLRLLREVQKQAARLDKVQELLIQVNIAGEEQKYGFSADQVEEALELVEECPNIRVKGMMMMAPFTDDPENVRHFFKEMSELFDLYKEKHYNNVDMDILSMGMSGDYKVAIEEGSNMIRIGSYIYKEEE